MRQLRPWAIAIAVFETPAMSRTARSGRSSPSAAGAWLVRAMAIELAAASRAVAAGSGFGADLSMVAAERGADRDARVAVAVGFTRRRSSFRADGAVVLPSIISFRGRPRSRSRS
jgi:hypothetical protein